MAGEEFLIESDLEALKPIDLSWNDLTCAVKLKQGEKQILKGISGYALHNELLVLMGSSGAGKTTLLNILSDKLQNSAKATITGQVLANGSKISKSYSNYIGYVTQEDILVETMTVYESLLFVANLKTNYINKKAKVLEIIDTLKLENCKNTLIGGHFRKGVSGGEKKRVSIGVELITNPSILFLDEPTSGLDSYTAQLIFKLLLAQASSGKTVITTIHQPSSDTFHLFDKLMLMCDGKIVFHGLAKESVGFFANCGMICPPLSNPADYFMEVLYVKNSNDLTCSEIKDVEKLVEANDARTIDYELIKQPLKDGKNHHKSFFVQFYMLTYRVVLAMIRNPMISLVRIAIILMIALTTLIFFWDIGTSGFVSIRNRNGFLFFTLACAIFCNAISCVLTFPNMRGIMIKEYHSNTYGVLPYFLAYNVSDLFFDALFTLFYVSITYWSVGLNTNDNQTILAYYLIIYLIFLSGGSIGILSGCAVGKPELALGIISGLMFPFMYFAGFYRSGNLPSYCKWAEYLSMFFYAFQALMKNQYTGIDIEDCDYCKTSDGGCKCDPLQSFDISLSLSQSIFLLFASMIFYRLAGLGLLILTLKRNKF